MAKYQVTVCRVSYAFNTVEVEAGSLDEASEIALDEAGDHDYSEKSADYELNDAIKIED